MKKWENADVVELNVRATAMSYTTEWEVDDEITGHVGKDLNSSGEKKTSTLWTQ